MLTEITKIKSLKELIEVLDPGIKNIENYYNSMKAISFHISEVENYCSWNILKYTRNLIKRERCYELILLCWEQNQVSHIHNHNGQDCWFRVISGELEEEQFNVEQLELDSEPCIKLINKTIYKTGNVGYIAASKRSGNNNLFHRIKNNGDEKAVSLHLYSMPIDLCKVYSDNSQNVTIQKLNYDKKVSL